MSTFLGKLWRRFVVTERKPTYHSVCDACLRLLGSQDLVLDIGVGWDGFIVPESTQCRRVVGIDVDWPAIAFTRGQMHRLGTENIFLVQADAQHLPFAPQTFDGVMCSEVIEHVPDDEQMVHEVARALQPGGKLVLSTPYLYWRDRIVLPWARDSYPPSETWGHLREGYTLDQLHDRLAQAGLRVHRTGYRVKLFARLVDELWTIARVPLNLWLAVRHEHGDWKNRFRLALSEMLALLAGRFLWVGNWLDDHLLSTSYPGVHILIEASKDGSDPRSD